MSDSRRKFLKAGLLAALFAAVPLKNVLGQSWKDKDGNPVYLAQSEWFLNTEITNNPAIEFHFTSEIHK